MFGRKKREEEQAEQARKQEEAAKKEQEIRQSINQLQAQLSQRAQEIQQLNKELEAARADKKQAEATQRQLQAMQKEMAALQQRLKEAEAQSVPAAPTPTAPAPAAPQQPVGTPRPEGLAIGAMAWVRKAGGKGLNRRSAPGLNSTVHDSLNIGTQVTLLEGPLTADGYTWWRIRASDGREGWVAGEELVTHPE